MSQEKIQSQYDLSQRLQKLTLQQAIIETIEQQQRDFYPLLERLIDIGDPRQHVSQETPLKVTKLEFNQQTQIGTAYIDFQSNFSESCLVINEYDDQMTKLEFRVQDKQLIFDITLPIAWNFNN